MPIPYHGPTSPQFAPKLGTPVADTQDVSIHSAQFVYQVPMITYVVQPDDSLAEVARRLYGVNTPDTRNAIRNAGFHPGSVINVPARTHTKD